MMNTFSQGPPHRLYKQTQAHSSLDTMRLMTLSSGWVMQTSTLPLIPCYLPHHLSNILLHLHLSHCLLNILHHSPLKVMLPCLSPMCLMCPQLEQLKYIMWTSESEHN